MSRDTLLSIYHNLYKAFGPQRWWPARSKFEVIVGAILTQNTSWQNVEKAISNLRKKKALCPAKLMKLSTGQLAGLIKSCGYYNVKAKRLKSFLKFINKKGGLNKLFRGNPVLLREQLLEVNGIGQETADSILLYAGNLAFFVVDAYTKRIFERHGLIKKDANYSEVQDLFMNSLPADTGLFNEYHALLVKLAKEYCRKKPLCEKCPLKGIKF